ncbi:cysteine peptidase family C39 domain-containing protein [uncultured Olleya sp.]|uniref:cysteine peptidase family C39 domain-containing protein n=1 Tax=uncultured Olleya sp. TaxID=757243 RepID=UPI002599ABE7|nr:cysteine peptidase family C39 domain-containing protein [uncultured Olleya sp.]
MNTTILENHRGMTNVHPLASLPFRSRPQQDLKPIYFPGGETKKIEDVIVTTDVGTDPNRIQHIASVKAFFDKNKDDKFSPFDDVFGYNIELYFSKDAIKLDKAFKEVEADEKGMIFFIEDNTDDISAQFCKIKIGRRVKDNLTDISQLYNSKSVYEYINSFVAIDRELFQELIIHGKLENVALEAVEFLFTAGNYFNPLAISKPIVEGLGTICHHISSFIDKGRLDDYRWNPNAKKIKEDGTEDTEHKFEPFLFPFIEGYLDQIDDSKINEYAIQSFKEFKSGFLEYDTSIRSYIKKTDFGKLLETNIPIPIGVFSSVTVPVEIDIIPDSAEAFLYSKYIQVSDAIINKLNDLETFDFTDLIKKGIRVANAFLCGIWNGLIDAVSGIFQLFEMVFKGVVAMVDFTDNFSTQFPILMEYIDNAIDAIKNIDFNLLYTHFKTKIKDATQSFETIAYFSGAFIGFMVGFVVEIVGGLLISGGTLSVASVLEKLASLFTSVLKGIAKAGKKVFDFSKKLVINTFKGFRKLLDQLIDFLRKGTKGFKEMIDKLFDDVKKAADEFFTQGKKLSRGGDITKSFAENAGLKIKNYISNGKVFGQTTDHTCVASSLKMILDDKGIIKLEDELARVLKTDSKGASILDIPEALYQKRLHESVDAIAEKSIKLSTLIEKLEDGSKAVVSIATKEFKGHAVLLEKIENGNVFLRDPLPLNQGSSYSISIEDFNKIFNDKAVIIKN